jgi:DNA repair photolyase
MGAGTDFERKIVVKPQAPELLRKCFEKKGWRGELVVFSGVTDCYQPVEASYELTRKCLEVCLEYRNPVSIITRSALIERDRDLLAELNRVSYCTVAVSVPFFDAENARAVEPHAPSPARRFKTISRLSEAGVPVGVNVAPIIPGLTDPDIPMILQAAREAGAQWAWRILLRLPGPVATVFEERMREAFPLRADKIMNQLNACRDGKITEARFGHRMEGKGKRWAIIEALFDTYHRKLGFEQAPVVPSPSPFQRRNEQLSLL